MPAHTACYHPPSTASGRESSSSHAQRGAHLTAPSREQIQRLGGELFSPPYYFGVCLDILPITVRADRVRAELGLELTPLEEGLRETYAWYRRQRRPQPDVSWEDRLLASAR